MPRLAALLLLMAAACGSVPGAEGKSVSDSTGLQVVLSKKPFWIGSGSAMAPLGGWGIVALQSATGGGRPKRYLVQGAMFENRFESYDVTNVQGLAIYPAGQLLFRDRFAHMERRGTLAEVLKELERFHDSFRRKAVEAIRGGAVQERPAEVMRTAIDTAAGTLLVRYAFYPTRQADPHGEWHHVDCVCFYDLERKKILRLHVFPVPLE
ncbi:MAG: hypothetical protein HY303_16940 [Candidatus Wallbacteria bacterium]|nr:hypothetical protein [Candidatus Wallbacteria bacterium]